MIQENKARISTKKMYFWKVPATGNSMLEWNVQELNVVYTLYKIFHYVSLTFGNILSPLSDESSISEQV